MLRVLSVEVIYVHHKNMYMHIETCMKHLFENGDVIYIKDSTYTIS